MSAAGQYEKADVNAGLIVRMAGVLLVMLVVIGFSAALLIRLWNAPMGGAGVLSPRHMPHPALLPSLGVELRPYAEEKRRVLASYGWVDREHGVVRIPIDRAMALFAARNVTAENRAPSEGPR